MDNQWIEDKVIIVTGGGSGIGQGIAIEAAAKGAKVVIADINEKGANETCSIVEENGSKASFIETDVTKPAEIKKLLEEVEQIGTFKYLVNSAGLQTYGIAETTPEETWDVTMDVNLKSMYLMASQAIPVIRENGGGGIVNISSVQGFTCQKNVLAYATSKGAVIAMTRSMGLDHAKEGIFVNCICPGSIDTPMLRYGAAKHGKLEDVLEEWGNHHPIGRIGTPEEIAKTAMFLLSPDSNFIVGQAIVADGGLGSIIL
ncbi:MAG: SDR family oxidoreductase [Cyclobacteriaceae bacterium]